MKNNKKGFTLVELVIVIAVIAILSAVLIPTLSNVIGNAKKSAAEQEAHNLRTQILVDSQSSFDDFCKANEGEDLAEGNILEIYGYSIELSDEEVNFGIGTIDEVWTMAYITDSGYVVTITDNKIEAVEGDELPEFDE